jgi:hypothetical protein
LFAKISDVGHDLFALDGEVLFNDIHVFFGDGVFTYIVGRDVGSKGRVGAGLGISMSLSSTLFRSSNVNFVELESKALALKDGEEPGGGADTSGLKEEGGLKEDENNRVAQETNWELSSNQLPGDGTKNSSGKGSHETQVEHLLDRIRDAEDVFFVTDVDVDGGDTGDDEEAKGDSHLTTAHESRKVLSTVLEKAFASSESHRGRSTFRLRKLGDAEEGNLHTLKKTNAAHKNDEEDERDGIRKSFPGRGLSAVEGLDGDGKGEAKKCAGEKNTSPEEGESDSGLRRFVGLDRLSGGGGDNHVDKVGGVHDSGNLNTGGDSVGEGHEVGVDVVKHHL